MTELIRQLLSGKAKELGGRPALISPEQGSISYDALARNLDSLSAQLAAQGIGRNDRVAMVLPNGLEMAIAFLGVAGVATAAPLNPRYTAAELDFYLTDLQAKVVITSTAPNAIVTAGDGGVVRQVAARRGIPILEIQADYTDQGGGVSLRGATFLPPCDKELTAGADIALILHTSGTTSRPKQVPLSHRNLIASAHNIARTLRLSAEDRCLNVMPLFHIHGLMAGLLSGLSVGASVVCTADFSAHAFFTWLDSMRPTWYSAVPTMHQAILSRAPDHRPIIERARLRLIRSSSAPLPPQVMAALEQTFGAPVIESYGMTEACHQIASNPLPPSPRKPGTVGLAAGPELAIMCTESAELLGVGQVGEIVIRGANVTAGYLDNPDANAAAFVDGWLRTGDLGSIDQDGYLTISARLKELINRGGEKIAPREVDEALLNHPAVRQAVAFAMPDRYLGEEVAAAVVLAPGSQVSETALQQHVAQQLADFKPPRRIVFMDEIPKGPTGKLQRIGLAAQLGLDRLQPQHEDDLPRADAEIENFLIGLWQELLHLGNVTPQSSFLELGGDSLLATLLINRVRSCLDIELTLVDFFQAPTVIDQAKIVQKKLQAVAPGNEAPISPVTLQSNRSDWAAFDTEARSA